MDLFLLKKIISVLIMPVNMVLLLLFFALILHWHKPKSSVRYLFGALIILLLSALPPISDRFMANIENDYPAFTQQNLAIDYIVILGCGHTSTTSLPVTSELATCSLQRMVEALRVFTLHPEARIITSGYSGSDKTSNAVKVKQALVLLGVPSQKIVTETYPKDTEEEAELISPRVHGAQVVLVTNAEHMPRAMAYFKKHSVYPIPAPTGYWVKDIHGEKSWTYYVPNAKTIDQTSVAWYETLGNLVQWFKTIF